MEIVDGGLDYVDEQSGLRLSLSGWQFDMGAWEAGKPFSLHTRFLLHDDQLPVAGVWTQIDAPELNVRTSPVFVAAPKLSVRFADLQADGSLRYETTKDGQMVEHSSASGALSARVPSLRKLVGDLGIDVPLPRDPGAMGALELTTDWKFADGAFVAKPVGMKIDETTFAGWVEQSAPPKSDWRFELRGDHVDLGRYFDVVSIKKRPPFELPVQALRTLNANGSLIFDQAQLADARMRDVRLRVQTPEENP